MIDVPEIQMELFRKVLAVNPNVVVVLFNGRPLDLREISAKAKAILEDGSREPRAEALLWMS